MHDNGDALAVLILVILEVILLHRPPGILPFVVRDLYCKTTSFWNVIFSAFPCLIPILPRTSG